jgi:uncharacterized membrane protein
MARMTSSVPAQKVTAGAIAGALVTIAIWLSKTYGHVDIPSEVAAAITTVLTFIVSYIVPPSERDQVQ